MNGQPLAAGLAPLSSGQSRRRLIPLADAQRLGLVAGGVPSTKSQTAVPSAGAVTPSRSASDGLVPALSTVSKVGGITGLSRGIGGAFGLKPPAPVGTAATALEGLGGAADLALSILRPEGSVPSRALTAATGATRLLSSASTLFPETAKSLLPAGTSTALKFAGPVLGAASGALQIAEGQPALGAGSLLTTGLGALETFGVPGAAGLGAGATMLSIPLLAYALMPPVGKRSWSAEKTQTAIKDSDKLVLDLKAATTEEDLDAAVTGLYNAGFRMGAMDGILGVGVRPPIAFVRSTFLGKPIKFVTYNDNDVYPSVNKDLGKSLDSALTEAVERVNAVTPAKSLLDIMNTDTEKKWDPDLGKWVKIPAISDASPALADTVPGKKWDRDLGGWVDDLAAVVAPVVAPPPVADYYIKPPIHPWSADPINTNIWADSS